MRLLILSNDDRARALLPALEFLDHTVSVAALDPGALSGSLDVDVFVVDATDDLSSASSVCRAIVASERTQPVLVVIDEGSLAALESSHAIAQAMKLARELPKDAIVLCNLSGRGDKDMETAATWFGLLEGSS